MRDKMEVLKELGLASQNSGGFAGEWLGDGTAYPVISPIDGEPIAEVTPVTSENLTAIVDRCHKAFLDWRMVPAPKRGEVVKTLGQRIGENKDALAELVTLEMGKTLREAQGEVQEMVDVFDFAVGLSRQLYGNNMPSERPGHTIREQWHPLGMTAVITAFNFPVAVWSWNAALALICGDTVLWKPSSKTPLTALAVNKIAASVLEEHGYPTEICSLAIGSGGAIGDLLTRDERVALVSYTGSVRRGRQVGKIVQERFGRLLLELGGNNAVIVSDKGDMSIALNAVYFGAVGTSGQRCTSTRRVIIHERVYDSFVKRLRGLYEQTTIGDPRDEANLMGPLVDTKAVEDMMAALTAVKTQGGRVLCGGERLSLPGGGYVTPCLVEANNDFPIVKEETFAPILYLMKYSDFGEALAMHNDVPQGLSSAVITNDLIETERFLNAAGSDCGLANVNTGTSGAEIGGAFGGEKETGGGRESGSDSWKAYMRRQTSVVNASGHITLAQGIRFGVDPTDEGKDDK